MGNRLLKIAFVIDDLGYGGAQRQLSILAPALKGLADPRVYCLSERVDPFAQRIARQGVPVTTFRRRGNVDFGRLEALRKRLSEDGADIVHGFLDASNVYATYAARRNHLPCILSLRNETHFMRGPKLWILCSLLRRAERVVVNSKAGSRYLADRVGVDPGRIALVPNAIGPPSDGPPATAGAPTVGFIGRLVAVKRADVLIDAFARLADRNHEAQLLILGDGQERTNLEDQVKRLGVGDRVRFLGNVNEVESWMGQMSCLVLPSTVEGFPNVAMEAIAAGVPVIASPAGDIRDIVRDGETGYVFEDDNPDALASLIERVLGDESLRDRVRKTGYRFITSRYSVESAVEILMGIYTDLAIGEKE
jgi:GalNAc-alpha-(1->4)-GalNAc-alpha-(1->3)-diNAcBac-PP-undecaprenol alpha-1,4-N-acetyl-D-galactosaminyltransferase